MEPQHSIDPPSYAVTGLINPEPGYEQSFGEYRISRFTTANLNAEDYFHIWRRGALIEELARNISWPPLCW